MKTFPNGLRAPIAGRGTTQASGSDLPGPHTPTRAGWIGPNLPWRDVALAAPSQRMLSLLRLEQLS